MKLIVPPPTDVDDESDEDLLLAIAAGDDGERDAAARVFFRRYAKKLFGFCRQFRITLGGDDGVESHVLRTFQRAFDRAATYKSEGILDRKHSEARTFRWLTTIAERMLRDWLRSSDESNPIPLHAIGKSNAGGSRHVEMSELEQLSVGLNGERDPHIDESNSDTPQKRLLMSALETLTEREKEIVLVSARYLDAGRQLRVDEEDLDELCRRWRTTRPYIRTIRSRAFRKIRSFVKSHSPR